MRFLDSLKGKLTVSVSVAIIVTGTIVGVFSFFVGRYALTAIIFALFLIGSVLAYLIARSISRPITELQEGVKRFAEGRLDTRISVDDGNEVTALADEFNRMAAQLNKFYEGLEHKVELGAEELMEANLRLQELDKLKSEFITVASHELRTPLASMKMGISNVITEVVGPLNEDQKAMLAIVDRNMDRLTNLTTDLLDITKIDAHQLDLELDEYDILKIAGDVAESNLARAEHNGIDLTVVSSDTPLIVLCDYNRMYQVMQNLIGNALRFTEKGEIKIIVDRVDVASSRLSPVREGETVVGSSTTGDAGGSIACAKVCVKDTGVGIPEEAVGTIFDKFSQAHSETVSEKRGTGLGLAISKGIVEAHGGMITAESTAGEGSTFCFAIPIRGPHEEGKEDTAG